MDFVRPGMYVTWPIGCYASITPELFEEEYAALIAWPVKFLARHRTAVSSEPLNRVLFIYAGARQSVKDELSPTADR